MKAIDLFAGVGGWDIAAWEFGYNPVGFEFNRSACATREAVGLPTIECDLSQYLFDFSEQVELFVASPPCQTFSVAGKNAGSKDWQYVEYAMELAWRGESYEVLRSLCFDPRSMLIVEPLKWINSLEPLFVAMEQVPPALGIWQKYARMLQDRGYFTWTGILSAEQYGVPQTRKRAILLASKIGPIEAPKPTHSKYYSRDPERLDAGVLPWISMAEALGWGYAIRPMTTVCSHPEESGFSRYGIDGGNGARQAQAQANGNWIVRTRGNLSRGDGPSAGGTQFDKIRWRSRNRRRGRHTSVIPLELPLAGEEDSPFPADRKRYSTTTRPSVSQSITRTVKGNILLDRRIECHTCS